MNCYIIHHDDPDGYLGGFILNYCATNYGGYENITHMKASYDTKFDWEKFNFSKDDVVYIVDYSLDNGVMKDLFNYIKAENVIWIDHHISAIENKDYGVELPGLRYDGLAGCELAWLYSKYGICKIDENKMGITIEGQMFDLNKMYFPMGLYLIGRFDTWQFDKKNPVPLYLIRAIRSYWDELYNFDKGTTGYLIWNAMISDTEDAHDLIETFISSGKTIDKYVSQECKTSVAANAFPTKLRKFTQYNVIALNTTESSSNVFNSVFNDYELGIVFRYKEKNGERKMTFSVYRLGQNPEKEINCAKIAESFGGGGHKSAAGFATSGTLPFADGVDRNE